MGILDDVFKVIDDLLRWLREKAHELVDSLFDTIVKLVESVKKAVLDHKCKDDKKALSVLNDAMQECNKKIKEGTKDLNVNPDMKQLLEKMDSTACEINRIAATA